MLNQVITAMNLTDIHAAKPIIDGKEICKLYGIQPGKQLKPLLDEILSLQILYPQVTEDDAKTYMMNKKMEFLAKYANG